MSKTLKNNEIAERPACRAILAIALATSLAAVGCTTNRNPGEGQPMRSAPGVGPVIPTSGIGGSTTATTPLPKPITSSSSYGNALPISNGSVSRADHAAAIISGLQPLAPNAKVLGVVNPGPSRPYASEGLVTGQFQDPAQILYPGVAVNSGAGLEGAIVGGGLVANVGGTGAVTTATSISSAATVGSTGSTGVTSASAATVNPTNAATTISPGAFAGATPSVGAFAAATPSPGAFAATAPSAGALAATAPSVGAFAGNTPSLAAMSTRVVSPTLASSGLITPTATSLSPTISTSSGVNSTNTTAANATNNTSTSSINSAATVTSTPATTTGRIRGARIGQAHGKVVVTNSKGSNQ